MSSDLPSHLLHGRNVSIPPNQKEFLERQTIGREHGVPEHDVPPKVLASFKDQYLKREQAKRDASEAELTPNTRVFKAARTKSTVNGRQARSLVATSSPSTPRPTSKANNNAETPNPPSSSPGVNLFQNWSLSPSQSRNPKAPLRRQSPSKAPALSYPSTGSDHSLPIELPLAVDQSPPTASEQRSEPTRSMRPPRMEKALLGQESLATGTPPCGQPSQPTDLDKMQGRTPGKTPGKSPSQTPGKSQRRPMRSHIFERAETPILNPEEDAMYRRHGPAASLPQSTAHSPSKFVPNSMEPPPGQSEPNPRWPAGGTRISRSSNPSTQQASLEVVGMTQATATEASQPNTFQGQMAPVQSMEYISPEPEVPPDSALSQLEEQQASHDLGGDTHPVVERDDDDKAGRTGIELLGPKTVPVDVRQASKNSRTDPTTQEAPEEPIRPPTLNAGSARIQDASPDLNGTRPPGHTPAASTSQDVSTISAGSAISATQQAPTLSISLDENSVSPWKQFQAVYSTYAGWEGEFVKACLCLEHMSMNNRLHQALWDDFIRVFSKFRRQKKESSERRTAPEWYNSRDEDPIYTQRLVGKQNLHDIIAYYHDEVEAQTDQAEQHRASRGPQPTKLVSISAESNQKNTAPRVSREPASVGRENASRTRDSSLVEHTNAPKTSREPYWVEKHSAFSTREPSVELGHSPTKVATTQIIDNVAIKDRRESSMRPHSLSTTVIESTPTTVLPSIEKQKTSSPSRSQASAPLVKNTPAGKVQRVSDPPDTLPNAVTAVHPTLLKDKPHQRHSTGALPLKNTTSQPMAPSGVKPKPPSSSARSSGSAVKSNYLASLMKPRKRLKKEEELARAKRKSTERPSLSKSDTS